MQNYSIKMLYCLIAITSLTNSIYAQDTTPALIPMPRVVTMGKSYFTWNDQTVIKFEAAEKQVIHFLTDQLPDRNYQSGTASENVSITNQNSVILITNKGSGQLPNEGYHLSITRDSIILIGRNAGIFYGLQTLTQLLPLPITKTALIPCLTIDDSPRFAYRGLMLDVSRHFFTVDQIKGLLDLMARYKLNRFHWHLTDDQGWRLEIKKYPNLTQIGSWRVPRIEFSDNTLPPQPGEAATDGGFYTQEQVREIIKYAAERFIEILPEIDVPGHSMAALAAYPELSVTHNKDIKVNPGSSFAKWFPGGGFEMYVDNSLNPTDRKVYEFLDNVFGEVSALFPYPYIHIGGDECYKGFWDKDITVQKFMKANRISNSHELQAYFVTQLNKIILSKNKKLIGWDEILQGDLKGNFAIMNRFGEKSAATQLKKGFDLILAPSGNGLYFDLAQSTSEQEPSSHGGNSPVSRAYFYNPVFSSLSVKDAKHIMGLEACVWTEHISTIPKLEYMLLPRMLALAETAWSAENNKNYNVFMKSTLPVHLSYFDKLGKNYRVPPASENMDTTIVTSTFKLELNAPVKNSKIYYTLNDRPPGDYDHEYTGPVNITVPAGKKIVLKTIVITEAGHRSIITRTILDNSDKSAN